MYCHVFMNHKLQTEELKKKPQDENMWLKPCMFLLSCGVYINGFEFWRHFNWDAV